MVKLRNSSFELLRIFLILLILVEHANMWFIGGNTANELEHAVRCIVQSICLPAVNAFVLISGWFGIKGDFKRLFPLFSQLFFCTIPFALIFGVLGKINLFSLEGVYNYLLGGDNYWFIIDYVALVLFAPLLNTVVENVDQKTLRTTLLSTYLLIVPMDVVLRTHVLGIEGGYSALWFIWLYLFARYVKIYGWKFAENHKWRIIVCCVILEAVLFYFGLLGTRYTNPLVLMPALCMLLVFRDFSFQSKVVNSLAPATLMVYMLHMQPCLVPFIRVSLCSLYHSFGYYTYMFEVLGMIVLLYGLSVLLYQLQSSVWGLLSNRIIK